LLAALTALSALAALAALAALSTPAVLEEFLEKFFKRRPRRQLRHGAAPHVHRLLGGDVDDRVYDLLRHIRYSLGPARGGLSGKSRPSYGGGDENSQAGTADGALQAEKGLAHGRRIS
jgi:hypothetical protein